MSDLHFPSPQGSSLRESDAGELAASAGMGEGGTGTIHPYFSMVASDIDGTLVGDDSVLPDHTRQVLQALLDKGVAVTLVTGMNPWVAKRYVDLIGDAVRIISLNGIVLVENGQSTESAYVPLEVAQQAIALMVRHGYNPLVYGEDGISRYLSAEGDGLPALRKLVADRPYQPFQPVSMPADLLAVRPAQVSICDTKARTAQLYPVLHAARGEHAYVIHQPATRSWLEVNHLDARKDTALMALTTRLDLMPEQVVYFGDNYNDQPVFERFPRCVAMGNAQPEIKAMAWKIAPPQSEQGVARTLRELFPDLLADKD